MTHLILTTAHLAKEHKTKLYKLNFQSMFRTIFKMLISSRVACTQVKNGKVGLQVLNIYQNYSEKQRRIAEKEWPSWWIAEITTKINSHRICVIWNLLLRLWLGRTCSETRHEDVKAFVPGIIACNASYGTNNLVRMWSGWIWITNVSNGEH